MTGGTWREWFKGRLLWDWHDWSLSYRVRSEPRSWQSLFGLRCGLCRRWTCGCSKHWFCDLCEPCRRKTEEEEA